MTSGAMRRLAIAGVALVALAGCGGPKAFVREGFLEHPPQRVAVLPFAITYAYDIVPGQAPPEAHTIGRDTLRKTFYYGLTPLNYHDVKLQAVDDALAAGWGATGAEAWRQASPQEIGRAVGADALVYGEIRRLMHFSTPLYTETSLDATVRMVDAATGETLWSKRLKVAERGGALLKKGQVVDLIKDQVRSFNPEVKFLRIADVAVRKALKDLPNPAYVADARAEESLDPARVRIAVLPLDGKHKAARKAAGLLRRELAAQLQPGPFDLIELGEVDAALKARGWAEETPLPDAAILQQVADEVGADLLLRGSVTSWGRAYWVVQSWVKAGMRLELVDAGSGAVIWSETKKNRRQAGILKGPTGYKSVVTAPVTGLKKSNLERVGTHLTRMMAEALMESPAVLAYVNRDVVASAGTTPASVQQ